VRIEEDAIAGILDQLSERDRYVLTARMRGDTFSAVAAEVGVTREKVRLIEDRWRAERELLTALKTVRDFNLGEDSGGVD
jgi:DNA-directed RNA polymerase sigma subunit (sigma70/sigma32)